MSGFSRRDFARFTTAAAGAAALAACASPVGHTGPPSAPRHTLGPVEQIDAGPLSIGYTEAGPAHGRPVILLHGWPYDIHSYAAVSAILAARGLRVIVPYLRGFGSTRFLSKDTVRNAQQSAIARDVVALMDALNIPTAVLGGYDWGARTAGIVAALWPQRCSGLVAVSGYLIADVAANAAPLPPQAEYGWWYQYYFSTQRGELGYRRYTKDFNRLVWQIASPHWKFDDATYDLSATAFENPDHTDIVVHNYRWRLGLAPGEAQYDADEARLATKPPITVPTITIASDFDGAANNGTAYRALFTGPYEHRTLDGIGHNVPQEAPNEFATAISDVVRMM
ncbi:alpha/beta fold hydrolase [Nocardia sp. GAS34]|uniref:alpha/beta fold hydrolase n=1 Tax=unclassified Nocardia TaxID=2637762 RepID=UPI003D22A976